MMPVMMMLRLKTQRKMARATTLGPAGTMKPIMITTPLTRAPVKTNTTRLNQLGPLAALLLVRVQLDLDVAVSSKLVRPCQHHLL